MLDPIRTWLASYLLWIKLGIVAALVIAAVVVVVKHDARIDREAYQRGYNARVAEEAGAAKAAAKEVTRREQASSTATHDLHVQLATEAPKIEATTHETAGRVRIIYRDHPVPADCVRPVGVQPDLDKARAAANSAAAGG